MPAHGKKCNKCGCLNHVAAVCKSGVKSETLKACVHTLLDIETGDSDNEQSLFISQLFVGGNAEH